MGGKGSGPKRNSETEKQTFAAFAPFSARSIYKIAQDETMPASVRLDAHKYICNRVWGTPAQEIGIKGEVKVYRTVEE